MRCAPLLGAALCGALCACSLMPRYQPPIGQTPVSYKGQGAQMVTEQESPGSDAPRAASSTSVWAQAQPADRRPRDHWWIQFNDPVLDELEGRVDAANPDLAAAVDRYQQAHALALEARSSVLPTIAADGLTTVDRQSDHRPLRSASQPDSYHDDLVGASASYELDLWGRVRSAVNARASSAQAAAADLESVRLELHAELASEYIALREQDAQRSLLEQTVDAYSRAVDMTNTRLQGGVSSGLDLAQAQTQLETARASLTDTLEKRALLEHALATLTGQIASTYSVAQSDLALSLPDVPLDSPSTLLERRPDVAAAERRMASYNAQIGVARAAFFPRISLAAVVGFEDTQGDGLLSAPNRFWAVGPQGLLTLFDAGYRSAVVANARAKFEEASNQYRATVLRAFQDVEDALSRQSLLRQELSQQQAARSAAERALQLALNRYQEGAVSYLQVVSTQITALQAERSALDLQTRQLQASVDLVRALGGGWQSPWPVTASSR